MQEVKSTRITTKDIIPKEEVTTTFLVKHLAVMTGKDGKKYLNLIFTDALGDLESRSWANAEAIFEKIEKGDFVEVTGKGNLFQGRKQFIVTKIDKIDPETIDTSEFLHESASDTELMYDELVDIVKELDDVYIKDLLTLILADPEITRRVKKWQAGKSIHHAYLGGLLEHILGCARLAVILSPIYKVNKNYVVLGAILHDICKIYELTDGFSIEYTEEGKLIGHLVKALEVVDKYSYKIKDFPYQTKLHIKHILLSHHGEYEYGSPKIPQTSEAMLVHQIDLMDSKMHTFETVKRTDNNIGHWSGFVRHLDRIVYKEELPFHSEYIQSEEKEVSKSNKPKPSNTKSHSKELKQNLGSALEGFKVKNSE